MAEVVYLLLQNEKIRDVINTITSTAVLILGRFTSEGKALLRAVREDLCHRDYVPILFDFDKPTSKDVTGNVETLGLRLRAPVLYSTRDCPLHHCLHLRPCGREIEGHGIFL